MTDNSPSLGDAGGSGRPVTTGRLLLRWPGGDITAQLFWPAADPSSQRTSTTVLLLCPDQPASLDPDASGLDPDAFGFELAAQCGAAVLAMPWQTSTPQRSVEYVLGWLADHAAELDAAASRLVFVAVGASACAATAVARSARHNAWPVLARLLLVLPLDPGQDAGQVAALVATDLADTIHPDERTSHVQHHQHRRHFDGHDHIR